MFGLNGDAWRGSLWNDWYGVEEVLEVCASET